MAISVSSTSVPNIEKLDGSENYSTWKFAMKMIVMLDGLWNITIRAEVDNEKDCKALAKI